MTPEEIKNSILSDVSLDPYSRIALEMFYEARKSELTYENWMNLYNSWRESEEGKNAWNEIVQIVSADFDTKVLHGLSTIDRGSYVVMEHTKLLGTFEVYDVVTRLRGLVTEEKKEILPCIFRWVSVRLDGFIEADFKGMDCSFMFNPPQFASKLLERFKRKNNDWDGAQNEYFVYSDTKDTKKTYMLCDEEYRTLPDEHKRKLVELLKKNHSIESLV